MLIFGSLSSLDESLSLSEEEWEETGSGDAGEGGDEDLLDLLLDFFPLLEGSVAECFL